MAPSQRQQVIVNCEHRSTRNGAVAGLRVFPGNPLKKQRKNLERLS
jgi:hypothetical protein